MRRRNRRLGLILGCVFIALVVFSGSGCQSETTPPQPTPTVTPMASPAPMGITGNCQAYD